MINTTTTTTSQSNIRSHFGPSHFLLERARCFSRSRALLVLPCPSVYNPALLSWHGRVIERMCQFLRSLPPLRIWVLPTALFLTSKEQDTVPVRWRRKSTKCSYKLRSCRYSFRASRFGNCVQTLSQTVASYDARITNIEQMVRSLAAHVTTLETKVTSVSSGPGSAKSWNILGHSDGSTATGLSGPMAQGHLMTIEKYMA